MKADRCGLERLGTGAIQLLVSLVMSLAVIQPSERALLVASPREETPSFV